MPTPREVAGGPIFGMPSVNQAIHPRSTPSRRGGKASSRTMAMSAIGAPVCGVALERAGASRMVFALATLSRICGVCLIPLGLPHFCQVLHILQPEKTGAFDRCRRGGKLTFVCQLADPCRHDAENAGRICHGEQPFHAPSNRLLRKPPTGNLMQAKIWVILGV